MHHSLRFSLPSKSPSCSIVVDSSRISTCDILVCQPVFRLSTLPQLYQMGENVFVNTKWNKAEIIQFFSLFSQVQNVTSASLINVVLAYSPLINAPVMFF